MRTLTILVFAFLTLPAMWLQAAEPKVRSYLDPGYRKMGVYAGGPKRYFDYSLAKMSLADKFPKKKEWWAQYKNKKPDHTVWTVFAGMRNGKDLETIRRRFDAWLKPEPGIPTYPQAISAICLDEENPSSRSKMMDALARHIRNNYKIPVFQWYTDPFGPNTNVTADGWVWDSYGWSPSRYRRHAMGFVLMGKPAICTPWATDPKWPQWTQYPSTAAMINREWHQFTTCMEFNISTAPFCVAGPGAMNPWLGSGSPDMKLLRSALRSKRREMHAIRPGTLPLATANFSAAARIIPAGGDPGDPSRYVDTFNGTSIVQDATITGFLDLMVTSRPAKPGFLVIRPRPRQAKSVRRPVAASLTYYMKSYFPLKSVKVSLKASAPKNLGAKNRITISTSEFETMPVESITQSNQSNIVPVLLEAKFSSKQGVRDAFVTLKMSQTNGSSVDLSHRLDELVIECEHFPPKPNASVRLHVGQYGSVSYDDDFTTPRWKHFGKLTASAKSHGGKRGASFWVGLQGGYVVQTTVTQRFQSPKPLKELHIETSGYANRAQLGGHLVVEVIPKGSPKPKWKQDSPDRFHGSMTLKVPPKELNGLKEFVVRYRLISTSGVEQGKKACATLERIRIRGR